MGKPKVQKTVRTHKKADATEKVSYKDKIQNAVTKRKGTKVGRR
jgi:hypothetical protein